MNLDRALALLARTFPNTLIAIAEHAEYGSRKHNPGASDVFWAYHKSTEHERKAIGHLGQAGWTDPETGKSHTINGAWRALAALETELIEDGATAGELVRFDR